MLKLIPGIFTPDMFRLIMEMGHGETLLIGDANYPWRSAGRERVYLPVDRIDALLAELLRFFPLDQTQPHAAAVMESARDSGALLRYGAVLGESGEETEIETVGRFAFYERAREAAGIIMTSDMTRGGNILLTKGTVSEY